MSYDPRDLNPSVVDAWEGRELKICSNTVECCKELTRVWLALGDDEIKRPYLGSASERVRKLKSRAIQLEQDSPDLRAEIAHAVEAIASIIEPWRDGKVLRQRIHAELTKLAAVRAGGVPDSQK